MALSLLEGEREKAEERRSRARRRLKISGANESLDRIGATFGMSGRSLRKIMDICAAAKADPDRFEHLQVEMDEAGKVDRAHKKLIAMRKDDSTPPASTA